MSNKCGASAVIDEIERVCHRPAGHSGQHKCGIRTWGQPGGWGFKKFRGWQCSYCGAVNLEYNRERQAQCMNPGCEGTTFEPLAVFQRRV